MVELFVTLGVWIGTCVVLILSQLWLTKRLKADWQRITVSVVAVTLLTGLFRLAEIPGKKAQREGLEKFEKAQRDDLEQFRKEIITKLTEGRLSNKDLEEYISFRYSRLFESSKKEAKEWARSLIADLPKKRLDSLALSESSQALAEELRIKWEPTYAFVLNEFDARLQELQELGHLQSSQQHETKLVYVDDFRNINESVRKATFKNGSSVYIRLTVGKIDKGVIVSMPEINVGESIAGQSSDYAFIIAFGRKSCALKPLDPRYGKIIKSINIENEDPLANQEFVSQLKEGLSKVIESVYLKDLELTSD